MPAAAKLPLGKSSPVAELVPGERPEGRGRAEGKDALGPDQGTIKYIMQPLGKG